MLELYRSCAESAIPKFRWTHISTLEPGAAEKQSREQGLFAFGIRARQQITRKRQDLEEGTEMIAGRTGHGNTTTTSNGRAVRTSVQLTYCCIHKCRTTKSAKNKCGHRSSKAFSFVGNIWATLTQTMHRFKKGM